MKTKILKIKIAGTKYDSRRKLTDKQKQNVFYLHDLGASIRKIAEIMGVSAAAIQHILKPPAKSKKIVHDNEYWRIARAKTAQKKQSLYEQGKI